MSENLKRSFYLNYKKLQHEIDTPVKIAAGFEENGEFKNFTPINITKYNKSSFRNSVLNQYIAIWDTGASVSCVSPEVADKLDLKVSGFEIIAAVGVPGCEYPTYDISILLPNNLTLLNHKVIGVEFGADLLIGMDIIRYSDFAICNNYGKTTFSLQMPSINLIDFTTSPLLEPSKFPSGATIITPRNIKIGRNEPCPCNSGKKYKKCCGRQ